MGAAVVCRAQAAVASAVAASAANAAAVRTPCAVTIRTVCVVAVCASAASFLPMAARIATNHPANRTESG
ncbi:hypothetical protein NS2_47240 [Nocardia seriolae NBRC 15557]|nr:hypothetical protein NS2_47240 [Nocardia seriolae NBRC 15557]